MANFITGRCPNCYARIDYSSEDTVVLCNCCDSHIEVAQLKASDGSAKPAARANAVNLAQQIDSSEAGMAYISSFFETYDWKYYNVDCDLFIPEITEMVDKNKIKHAANPVSWELELVSIAVPVGKKIEHLKTLAANMAAKYNGVDDTNLYDDFDLYCEIIKEVENQKEYILKTFEVDVKFAEQFGASTDKLAELNGRVEELKALIDVLVVPEKFSDIPEVLEAIKEKEAEIVHQFEEQGIQVEDIYNEACGLYNRAEDINRALSLFDQIRGYKEANSFIDKINKYFLYNAKFVIMLGKNYVYLDEKSNEPLDLKKLKKGQDKQPKIPTFALYIVEDGKPSVVPVVEKITDFITVYGENFFYIKNAKELCVYNLNTKATHVLNNCGDGGYADKSTFYFNATKTRLYLKRILALQNQGCFGKKKDAEANVEIKNGNNYEILELDLMNAKCEVILPGVVDILDFHENTFFYLKSKAISQDKNGNPLTQTEFLLYDTERHVSDNILGDECEVHDVVNGNIVYSVYKPTELNRDLYTINLVTREKCLVEDNVYTYFSSIDGRLFYTIGNVAYRPLFSNNVVGTDRQEIMQNVEHVVAIKSGWMYVIKGYGRNNVLMKISSDGKQKVYICTGFKELVKFTNGHLYYINYDNQLRVVRNDGYDDRKIADNLANGSGNNLNEIIIENNYIFYVRNEKIGSQEIQYVEGQQQDNKAKLPQGCANFGKKNVEQTPNQPQTVTVKKDKFAKSIYRMDLDGHNVKKLAFNVDSMQNYDENVIYFCASEELSFSVTTTQAVKKNESTTTAQIKKFDVTRYYSLNKHNGRIDVVLSLGLPDNQKPTATGCGKKASGPSVEYVELPNRPVYKHEAKVKAGSALTVSSSKQNNKGCGKK